MRKSTYLIIVLILINFIVSAVFIALFPAEIPTKFDFHGNVSSYGSKLGMLVMPVTILVCGATATAVCEKAAVSEKEKRTAAIITVVGLIVLTAINIFTLLQIYNLC